MQAVAGTGSRRADAAPWLLMAAFTLLRIGLAFRFPLHPDETYYWEWSRRPAWGYYDQGPMIAWWIRAFCRLFGDTPAGIRLGIVAAALATQVFLYLLARDLLGRRAALLSLLPAAVTPLALAGGFIATYDPLVALFWAAAMYFTARALFFDSRPAWIGVGLAFGLGLLSKHTMVLFAPGLLLFLAALPAQRRWLRRPEPYAALLLALAVFAPNLLWQSTHDWMTFRHLFLLTGKGTDNGFARRLGDYVGSQAGLMTPLLFLGMGAALVWAGRRGRQAGGEGLWFLFAMSAPVLLFFLLMTLKAKVQANWAVCGWLTPPLLFAAWTNKRRESRVESRESKDEEARGRGGDEGVESRESRVERERGGDSELGTRYSRLTTHDSTLATLFFWSSLALSGLLSLLLVWPEARRPLHLSLPASWDQMNKLYGGPEIGAAADRERRRMERETGQRVAAGAATYDNASRLAFYMTGQPRTCCLFLGTRLNSYLLWNAEAELSPGRHALIVDDRPPDDPELPAYGKIFRRVEPVPEPVFVYRRGVYDRPVRIYHLYRCYDYRPDPEAEQPSGG